MEIDPNDITGTVRKIRAAKDEHDIKAITSFPSGCNPQVPVSDRRYYPMGLSLRRTFEELPNVPFRDHVWPKFLSENGRRVFKL